MLRRERKRLVDELKDYQESGYKEGQKEVKQHLNKLDRLFKHLERKTK